MRDILTVCAVALIAALLAALVGPHFIDWNDQRARIDAALSEALGLEVATQGAIDLRVLPSPVVQLDGLTVRDQRGASAAGAQPLLTTGKVRAELALGALLAGKWRIVDAAIDRPTLRIVWSTAPADSAGPPAAPAPQATAGPEFNAVRIANGAVVIADASGRQRFARSGVNAELSAGGLAGPWRIHGDMAGAPFSLGLGARDADGRMRMRLNMGGADAGRLEFDGAIATRAGGVAGLDGKASFQRRKQDRPPVGAASAGAGAREAVLSLGANVALSGAKLTLEQIQLEMGDISSPLRLEGAGGGDLSGPDGLQLSLRAARLDLDAIGHPRDAHSDAMTEALEALAEASRAAGGWSALAARVSVRIEAGALILGEEETGSAAVTLRPQADRLGIENGRIELPAGAFLGFFGEITGAPRPFIFLTTHSSIPQPAALAPWLRRVGMDVALADWLARQKKLSLAGRLALSRESLAVHGLRLAIGDGDISGMLAVHAGDLRAPARLQALLSARRLDLADMPPGLTRLWRGDGLFAPVEGGARESSLVFSGAQLRFGRLPAVGDVQVQASSDGAGARVSKLHVQNLAGVDITAAGALTGEGEPLKGVATARDVTQLATLVQGLTAGEQVGPMWRGLLRAFQQPEMARPARINFGADMRGADGALVRFDAAVEGEAGLEAKGELTLTAADAGAVPRVARVALDAKGGDARLLLTALAPMAPQLAATQRQPGGPWRATLKLGADDASAAGAIDLAVDAFGARLMAKPSAEGARFTLGASDSTPLLRALGLPSMGAQPWKLEGVLADGEAGWRLHVSGDAGGTPVKAELGALGERGVGGFAELPSVSLAALAQTLALGPVVGGGDSWSARRFGPPPRGGDSVDGLAWDLTVRAGRLDLGQGVSIANAGLGVSSIDDGVRFALAGGTVTTPQGRPGGVLSGALMLRRQGGSAALSGDMRLADADLSAWGVRGLSGVADLDMKFGASGESVAAMVANLGGNGLARLRDGALAGAAPGAPLATALNMARDATALDTPALQRSAQRHLDMGSFPLGDVRAPVVMTGAVMRLDPPAIAADGARLDGGMTIDLRAGRIDAQARLQADTAPPRWKGAPPAIQINWRGPWNNPARTLGVNEMQTALAALRLEDELERVEAFRKEAQRLREESQRRQDEARRRDEERARLAAEAELRRAREELETGARDAAQPAPQAPALSVPPAGVLPGPRAPLPPPRPQ